jgi:hypothetical protein
MITLNTTELELKKAYVPRSAYYYEGPIDKYAITYRSIYSNVSKSEQVQSSESVEFDTVSERVIYTFPSILPAGSKAILTIVFGGRLTGSMAGYYRSSWEHEGKKKHYALTQFEASCPDHRLI